MKTTLFILFIGITLLSGCSTTKLTADEESYLDAMSKKKYNNRFDKSEMKVAWKRAKEFWKPYTTLKTYTLNKFETEKSSKTEITYTIKRTPLPNKNYIIRITASLSNPLMTDVAARNSAVFYEYINTGKLKYPQLVVH